MVRSQYNRLHPPPPQPPLHPQDAKDRFPPNRPRRTRSPGYGQTNYRKSPRPIRRSPMHATSDVRGNRNAPRGPPYRRDSARGGQDPRGGNRDVARTIGNNNNNNNNNNNYNREVNRRPKWRRIRNKKKKKGKRGIPPLSGGNRAPVAGGNRQPIASMRMRMDDYVAPRMGRLLPLGKTNDIERAVARARREASTRTKDTFWTKKLLDAETTHPNRWAHTGFKELYREELGYSELDKEKGNHSRSPPRGPRDDKNGPKRPRSPTSKQRPSRERLSSTHKNTFATRTKPESRKRGVKSPRRSRSKSRSRSVSRSRSPRSRKKPPGRVDLKGSKQTSSSNRKSTYLRPPNKRPYSRSLSASPSTISSRSRSYSRSYSSYSRSSSFTSTSSSSTFTATSSGSERSRSYRRSYSRSSKSWSRSPSVPRAAPPAKIKTASLSKAVQSVHMKKDKKKALAKAAVNPQPKNFFPTSPNVIKKQKSKAPPRGATEAPPPPNPRHNAPISPPASASMPPPISNEYYEKDPVLNKSPVFVEPEAKAPFKPDVRRGPESQNYKGAMLSREMNAASTTVRSEGEQTNTDSSSDDDDIPMKMTLSERFGKLAQLSSQRQEYEGVRMKIVREGGQDKKVYLEGDSRSPSPLDRRNNGAHERWLREHKAEYDEYEERYGEFRHWDPHRDLPRELPPNWDDVNVRYRYYKESSYFGERSITMEDYLKWEEWWYRYRDWLEKYGDSQEEAIKYRGPYNYDSVRVPTRDRWVRREKEDRKRHRY